MADVVAFPPLPPVPDPPTETEDARQASFRQIAAGLVEQLLQGSGGIATANLVTGYRASAVDVGHLQEVIERGLERFDMEQVRRRWDDDVFAWLRQILLAWIQRCKFIHFELEENGIRIQLQTQDDRGYYHYEFDVFPGRISG
ncbi:MAG TPA: hypothetical protein VMU84_00285 [Thermoanaerobaculia bacterium]|nr:hypothetical protein [Thermoanaerobaculia bacterium]